MRAVVVVALLAACVIASGPGCEPNARGALEAPQAGSLAAGPSPRGHFAREVQQACGVPALTAAGERVIDRQPYLQQVTHRSAHLLWTMPVTQEAAVLVRRPDGMLVAVAEGVTDAGAPLMGGRQRRVAIGDLQPDAIHCYELHGEHEPLHVRGGFRTAPAPGSDRPVRFVNLGDVGTATEDQLAVRAQMKRVEHDLVLVNGDVAYEDGRLDELERHFFEVYAPMLGTVPFYPAIGNHDVRTDDGEPFRQVFDLPAADERERWYSFSWGMLHVVVLDSERIEPAQVAWLAADLSANELPWTIVVTHRPPLSSGRHGSDGAMREHFVPLFEEHGVDVVFAGHDHHYERSHAINGVHYIVSGGGGRGVRSVAAADFAAFAAPVAHFVYGVVDRDELRLWAIDASGRDFDSLRIRKLPNSSSAH